MKIPKDVIKTIMYYALIFLSLLSCNNNFFHDLIPQGSHEIVQFKVDNQIGDSEINEDTIVFRFDYDNENELSNIVPNIELAHKKATLIPITSKHINEIFEPDVINKYYSTRSSTLDISSINSDTIVEMIKENKKPIPDFKNMKIPIDFRYAVKDPVQPVNPVHFVVISPSVVGREGIKIYKVFVERVHKDVKMKEFSFNKGKNPDLFYDAIGIPDHIKRTIEVEVLYPIMFSKSHSPPPYELIPNFDIVGDKVTDKDGNIIENGITAIEFTPQGDNSFNTIYKGLGEESRELVVSRKGFPSVSYTLHIVFAELNKIPLDPPKPKVDIAKSDYVTISWDSVDNASEYEVYQSNSSGGPYTNKVATTTETTATITELNPNTIYYYKVKAIGGGDYSDSQLSDYIEAKTNKIPLDTPKGLKQDNSTDSSVTISWNSVENASSYKVYQYVDGNDTEVTAKITINGTTAKITGLNANTIYYYKVMAVGNDPYSNSKLSEPLAAITDKIKLDTPKLELKKITAVPDATVTLSWNSVANASSYEVYQSDAHDGDYTKITATIITIAETNQTTITGLIIDTIYHYKVKAIGSGAYLDSLLSNYINITAGKIPLDTPILKNGTVTDNSISFSWGSIDNADGYEVYQYNISDGTDTKLTATITPSGTNFSTTINGLDRNTTYYYKVKALGSGSYSDSQLSDPLPDTTLKTKLDPPTGLKQDNSTDSSVNISWNSVINASGYEVYQSTTEGGTYSKVTANIIITGTSAIITGLNRNTNYYYKVKAIGSEDFIESELSAYLLATTLKTKLATPTLTLEDVTINSISLSWNSVTNANSYKVYECNSSGVIICEVTTDIIITGTTTKTATITGLTSGNTYYYEIMAIGNENFIESELSNVISGKPKTKLQAPTLKSGTVTDSSVTFSWNSINNASSYEVYQSTTSGGTYTKVATITGTSATITGLTRYTDYYYKIIAIGVGDYLDSDPSNPLNMKTAQTPLTTPTLNLVRFEKIDFVNYAELSWKIIPNASKYEVYRSTDGVSYSNVYTTSSGTTPGVTFKNTSVITNTHYYYKIKAIGGGAYSDSSYSNVVDFTITIPNSIGCGYSHTLAVHTRGQLKSGNLLTWGRNNSGQLGDGTTKEKSTPTKIKDGTIFTKVAGGSEHSLAIDEDGYLWAWGNNGNGRLGDNTTTKRESPVRVKDSSGKDLTNKFIAIAAGYNYSLAIDSTGKLLAWGGNSDGQLGDGTIKDKNVPTAVSMNNVPSGRTFIAVAAGYYHSLAIDNTGQLWGWGENGFGQVGDGTSGTDRTAPVKANVVSAKFTAVAAGYNHSLAIDTSGLLWTWGYNNNGQLGNGATSGGNANPTPLPITKDKDGNSISTTFIAVAGGGHFSLAVDKTGKLWSWGRNNKGQLGNGGNSNTPNNQTAPGYVTGLANASGRKFTAVAAGGNDSADHILAMDDTGQLWAWGENSFGQLGNGITSTTPKTSLVEVNVSGLLE